MGDLIRQPQAEFCQQPQGSACGTSLAELSDENAASRHLDFSLVRPRAEDP